MLHASQDALEESLTSKYALIIGWMAYFDLFDIPRHMWKATRSKVSRDMRKRKHPQIVNPDKHRSEHPIWIRKELIEHYSHRPKTSG